MSIDLKDLIAAGVHFGHQTSRWSPKMKPYIWGHKNKVHLIDVSQTAHHLEKAAEVLKNIAAQGKQILFVGTKKPAQEIIKKVAGDLKYPSVTHRWIGGTLTNFDQVNKSRRKLGHFQDVLDKSSQFSYTKKELNVLQKSVNRLEANIGGIMNLRFPIGALVVVDVKKEQAAVKEANVVGIPVVGLVDTNSNPTLIDYVIPANDDSVKSISIILNYLGQHIAEGQAQAAAQKAEAAAAAQQQQDAASNDAVDSSLETALASDVDSEEEGVAREQARARKLRESLKARKGDPRRGPAGRGRKPTSR